MEPINLILFDHPSVRAKLLPFTFTRPEAEIRIGILTIAEKWEKWLGVKPSFMTQDYLQGKYPANITEDNLGVSGSVLPDAQLVEAVKALQMGEALFQKDRILAVRGDQNLEADVHKGRKELVKVEYPNDVLTIDRPWDIFAKNGKALQLDFELLTNGRTSQPLGDTNRTIGEHPIFMEEGTKAIFSTFNTTDGPIYIGKVAEVMEGCSVRGPFALGEHSTLKMGAKIYGPTTIGPHCKVGGEINNSVIFGYSNKAHDGFLGNSVLGEWCNLGADTNNSNLKNNYGIVKVWSYAEEAMVETGLLFCGMFMGDHSKSGINTMFNTGTVVGVSANVFGGSFPQTMLPSFSWGGGGGFATYHLNKAFEVAERVMERRGLELTRQDREILANIFEVTAKYRKSQLDLI